MKIIHKILVRFILRFLPSMLSLKCDLCGKIVDPENAASHYSYFHPGDQLDEEGRSSAERLAQARKRVKA